MISASGLPALYSAGRRGDPPFAGASLAPRSPESRRTLGEKIIFDYVLKFHLLSPSPTKELGLLSLIFVARKARSYGVLSLQG